MSTRLISAWIVPLVGHQFDLEDLPLFLEGSFAQVAKREDAYYLVLPTSLAGSAPELIRALAAQHLALINGASSLLSESFRPIALGEALYGIDSEGHVANTVIQIGSAELRMKGGHVTSSVNGIARPDARVGAALPLMRAAAASTAAADVLVIVGRPNPTWSELYLVYELIESNCGGRMFDLGWIQKSDATLFCRTANSYTALGRKARHGKDRGQPPQSLMPQHEAKTLMLALAAGWLRHVSSAAP